MGKQRVQNYNLIFSPPRERTAHTAVEGERGIQIWDDDREMSKPKTLHTVRAPSVRLTTRDTTNYCTKSLTITLNLSFYPLGSNIEQAAHAEVENHIRSRNYVQWFSSDYSLGRY